MGKWTTIAEAAIEVLAKKSGGALPAAQPTSGSGDAMVDVLRPIDENSLLWLSQQPVGRMPPGPVDELRPYRQSPFQRIGNFAQDAMQGAGMDRYAAHTLRGQLFGAQGNNGRGIGVADFVPGLDTSAAADDYRANPGLLTGAGVGLSMLPLVGGFAAKGIGRLGRGLLDDVPTSMFDVDPTMPAKLVNPEMRVFQGGPNLYGPDVPGTKPGLDSSKIGTGEGAQVYGHGHYLAEGKGTAKYYQETLGMKNAPPRADLMTFDGQPLGSMREYQSLPPLGRVAAAQELEKWGGDGVLAAHQIRNRMLAKIEAQPGKESTIRGMFEPAAELAERIGRRGKSVYERVPDPKGHLYEYDLPDETISKMLDWDKPLSEQPQAVRDGVRKLMGGDWAETTKNYPDLSVDGIPSGYAKMTGGDIHHALAERVGGKGPVEAQLREAGIPGIRYLDQGSRSGGKGTSNFVLFDDDAAKLLARDDTRFDLPTDEASRMARAREMGFDTDVYHATQNDFDEFDPGYRGASFVSDSPSGAQRGASGGAQDAYGTRGGEGSSVMPLKIKSETIMGLNLTPAEQDWWKALPERPTEKQIEALKMPSHRIDYWWRAYDEVPNADGTFTYIKKPMPSKTLDDVKRTGTDVYGSKYFGTYEGEQGAARIAKESGMGGFLLQDEAGISVGITDPKNIRSRFAKFDPAKKDSANILAGLGVVGAGAALSQQDGFDYGALRNVAEGSNGQRSN